MRRLLLLAALALLAVPSTAAAHPLGNFSINHLTEVRVAPNRIDILYVLDEAEIPTFQERGLPAATVVARKRAEVQRQVRVTVGGRPVALAPAGPARLTHPPGQGGLSLTRLELPLTARAPALGNVAVHDGTFPGRVGWHAVLARPGRGTAVRSDVTDDDPTGGLHRYPAGLLRSPAAVRDAHLTVARGAGTVQAPHGRRLRTGGNGDGFAGILDRGHGVLLLLLAAAFGWGAVHALSPGHGKTMVAAYLVGTRGSARDAVALGATVTVTHTAGVVALGVVALALSAWIVPEHLYAWLNLVAGLLVVGVGAQVLRSRLKKRHHHHHHEHHHHTRRSVLALGASAGLIPCPTALVVLLGAISQHQVALGLLLIAAFSAGLATTLTGLGLSVVHASRLLSRLRVPAGATGVLSSGSAALVLLVGCVLTAQAVPRLPL